MKPKCFKSVELLGRAWLDGEVYGGDFTWQIGKNFISANQNAIWIWNGDIPQILVRRHKHFPLVIGLRFSSPPLGKIPLALVASALEIPEVFKYSYKDYEPFKIILTEAYSPVPYTFVDNLEDESIASCDREALQHMVLKSSAEALKRFIEGYKKYRPKDLRFKELEDSWGREKKILQAVGLTMPKEYEEEKIVAFATRRLRTRIYHE